MIIHPPSTIRSTPVTYDASSDARKATAAATSSDRPSRLAAVPAPLDRRCSSETAAHGGVRIAPGTTVLTRTSGPYSTANWRPSADSPAFDAAYAGRPGRPTIALTEEVSTIAPRLATSRSMRTFAPR